MKIILRWIVSTLTIFLCAYLIEGVYLESILTALWLSLFLGLVNFVVKPILVILTLPINIITFGLFTLVINASLVLLASWAVDGFSVSGFWIAMLFSVAVSIIGYLMHKLFGTK